ncbi:MAG: hypothetical protein ABIR03_13215 [Ginsengibacter sp.]
MPESIDIHIKNIQTKLQLLLKKHVVLVNENARLVKENQNFKSNETIWTEKMNSLELQVNILKASAGKLEGKEKNDFERTINQYIRSLEKCMAILNN